MKRMNLKEAMGLLKYSRGDLAAARKEVAEAIGKIAGQSVQPHGRGRSPMGSGAYTIIYDGPLSDIHDELDGTLTKMGFGPVEQMDEWSYVWDRDAGRVSVSVMAIDNPSIAHGEVEQVPEGDPDHWSQIMVS